MENDKNMTSELIDIINTKFPYKPSLGAYFRKIKLNVKDDGKNKKINIIILYTIYSINIYFDVEGESAILQLTGRNDDIVSKTYENNFPDSDSDPYNITSTVYKLIKTSDFIDYEIKNYDDMYLFKLLEKV